MKEIKVRLTKASESNTVLRLGHKYEQMVCDQYKCTYRQYGAIVKSYIGQLAKLAEIQGYDENVVCDALMKYYRSYNKQATAQKAINNIIKVYFNDVFHF